MKPDTTAKKDMIDLFIRRLLLEIRMGWFVRSVMATFTLSELGGIGWSHDVWSVFEDAKEPRIIVHPKMKKRLIKNTPILGRLFGFKFIEEKYAPEDSFSCAAMEKLRIDFTKQSLTHLPNE